MRETIMIAKYAIAGVAGTALLASVAFAQSPPAASDTTKNSPTTTMSDTSTSPSSFQGNWRASKLVGLSVYNEKNESVGSINDMLTDKNGKIVAVVSGVGGFLLAGPGRLHGRAQCPGGGRGHAAAWLDDNHGRCDDGAAGREAESLVAGPC